MRQVTLRGLRKKHGGADVIKGIDRDARDGEFFVFVGPPGCGKSTTQRRIDELEAMTMCDCSAVFNQGVAEQLDTPMAPHNRPGDAAPAAHCTLSDALAADAPAGIGRVGLRPEHLRVVGAGQGVCALDLLTAKVGAGQAPIDPGQVVGLKPDASWALAFSADARLAA